jgi:MFS family permease
VLLALLADAFPPAELGRAMAWNSVLVGLGTGSGPVLGGLITQHFGWRWVFLLSVPVGVLAAVIAARALPASGQHQRVSLDIRGATLLAIGLAALTLGVSFGGPRSPPPRRFS